MAEKYPLASKDHRSSAQAGTAIYIAGLSTTTSPKGRGGDHSGTRCGGRRGLLPEPPSCPLWGTHWCPGWCRTTCDVDHRNGKDLSRPAGDLDFAQLVGDQIHLDFTCIVLTVCRHQSPPTRRAGTPPTSLLRQLYTETKRALRRGSGGTRCDREERIRQTQTAALDQLVRNGIDQDDAEQLWSQLETMTILRHTAGDVAWHTEDPSAPGTTAPLVLIKETTQREFETVRRSSSTPPTSTISSRCRGRHGPAQPEHQTRGSSPPPASSPSLPISCSTADGDSISNNPGASPRSLEGLSAAVKEPDDYPTIIPAPGAAPAQAFRLRPAGDHLHRRCAGSVLEVIAPTPRPAGAGSAASSWISTCQLQRRQDRHPRRARGGRLLHHRRAQLALADPDLCKRLQAALVEATVTRQRTGHPACRINFTEALPAP